jgi:hypothetical protein
MDGENMESATVADGFYDLCADGSTEWFRSCFAWLKDYYVRHGKDPAHIRRDVLAYGHAHGELDWKFSILLSIYVDRLQKLERYRTMDVANDCDPDGPHPAQWTHEPRKLTRLRRRYMPELRWPPFKLVARVHVWTFDELAAFRRRQRH